MGRNEQTLSLSENMRELAGWTALAGTFNAQDATNTLWAYATMGRDPGAGVMREGRAEALAGTFNAQDVTLWAACAFSLLRASDTEFRFVDTVVHRLASLDKPACFNSAELCQVHQFFLSYSVETRLVVKAIKDMQSLKDTCRLAFEGAQTNPSATQQQVSETLRHMGLSVEDEVRCPKSGYSIDMLAHDSALETGGERSSGRVWAVEFDGPSQSLKVGT
jgi:hypothetical protein